MPFPPDLKIGQFFYSPDGRLFVVGETNGKLVFRSLKSATFVTPQEAREFIWAPTMEDILRVNPGTTWIEEDDGGIRFAVGTQFIADYDSTFITYHEDGAEAAALFVLEP